LHEFEKCSIEGRLKMVRRVNFSPRGTEALYREREGKLLIELELHSMMQIFNSFDPAPFHEKELDASAEVYIYNSVDEFPLKKPLEIMIYLPSSEIDQETEHTLKEAIRNHFSYKKLLTEIELRRLFQRGRKNMSIAIVFLFLCLLMIRLLSSLHESLFNSLFSEGLLIIGWVAMWEPVDIFLYRWWPLVHKKNIYSKILGMDVSVGTGSPEARSSGYRFVSGKKPEKNLNPG